MIGGAKKMSETSDFISGTGKKYHEMILKLRNGDIFTIFYQDQVHFCGIDNMQREITKNNPVIINSPQWIIVTGEIESGHINKTNLLKSIMFTRKEFHSLILKRELTEVQI